MVKFLSNAMLFFYMVKPGTIVPWLGDRAFFAIAGVTIVLFAVGRFMQARPLGSLPLRKYVYALIVVYALSIAQTGWLGGAVDSLIIWLKVALIFTVLADVNESVRDVRRTMWTTVIVVATLAWLGWDAYLANLGDETSGARLSSVGFYNNSNAFALTLSMGSALVFALFESGAGFAGKLLLPLLLGGFAVTSVYTKSRAGTAGLGLVVLLSLVLSRRLKSRVLKGALVGLVIAGMAVAVPSCSPAAMPAPTSGATSPRRAGSRPGGLPTT